MTAAERNKKNIPTTCFRLVLLRKYENMFSEKKNYNIHCSMSNTSEIL